MSTPMDLHDFLGPISLYCESYTAGGFGSALVHEGTNHTTLVAECIHEGTVLVEVKNLKARPVPEPSSASLLTVALLWFLLVVRFSRRVRR